MSLSVLFVDDEPAVLASLRRMLRQARRSWTPQFVESGDAALGLLSHQHFDAIVSDSQMPGMDGATLLERTRAQYPAVARIMLSGEVKPAAAVRVAAAAHQFLQKPCPADTLCAVIERVTSLRRIITDPRALALVTGIGTLPTPPASLTKLNLLLTSDTSSVDDVADTVADDVAMTSKVLQMVNSAFFGVRTEVNSVHRATAMLGLRVLQSLTATGGILRIYEGLAPDLIAALESHSQIVARLAASGVADTRRDLALAAGLLHDVGWLILADAAPTRFAEFLARSGPPDTDHELEREVFGACHDEVGAALLALWGLPDDIVEAVAWHHADHLPPDHVAAHIARAHADSADSIYLPLGRRSGTS